MNEGNGKREKMDEGEDGVLKRALGEGKEMGGGEDGLSMRKTKEGKMMRDAEGRVLKRILERERK